MGGNHGGPLHPALPEFLVPPGDDITVDFELCVRLTKAAPLREQVLTLLDRLSDLSVSVGAEVSVDVEPNGDACDTGIALTFTIVGDVWIAELNMHSSSPCVDDAESFDAVRQRILPAGWALAPSFHDPSVASPLEGRDRSGDGPPQGREEDLRPRLVIDRREPGCDRFVDEVLAVAMECMGAASSRWFLSFANADATFSERLSAEANRLGHRSDQWPIDLAKVLPPEWTTKAVWPRGSESAHLMCSVGAHHLHEAPCIDGRVFLVGDDELTATPQRHLRLPGSSPDEHFLDEVRLTDAVPLDQQLRRLLDGLSELSLEFDGEAEVFASPSGRSPTDGCFVQFAVFGNLWVVDLSPRPKWYGGEIPPDIVESMEQSGWIFPSVPATPDPVGPARSIGLGIPQIDLPCPRLICDRTVDDPDAFVANVIETAHLAMVAPEHRWFLGFPRFDGRRSPRLRALAAAVEQESLHWRIDLAELLPADWTGPAVWPTRSARGRNACIAGLHHRHEPPCIDEIGDEDWFDGEEPRI